MEKLKFKVGDVLVRTAYKESKSKMMRDECKVIDIVSDEHPICPQTFYLVLDYNNKVRPGLKCVMEEAFEKVC
jgi:hypothetical protein